MKLRCLFLFVFFVLFQFQLSFSQFEINTFETIHLDSTSQEERIALFYYKNYPYNYFNNTSLNTTKKYNFSIILINGDTIKVKSQIHFSEDKHYILNGSNKIYPENTKEIVAHFDEYDFIGIPNNFCWLFRNNDDNDPIFTYSFLPKDNNRYILFAKLQNNNLLPVIITTENIINLVKDDKIALEYALKNKPILAIKQYNLRHYPFYK